MSVRGLIAALAGAAAVAAPASAAVDVVSVDTSAYPTVRLTVATSPPSPNPPRVAERDGRVAGVRATNLAASPSIAIVLDRSQSMGGRPLAEAVGAATRFVERKRPAERVAVFAFGSDAVQLTAFSAGAGDHIRALREIAPDRRSGTALYDAVERASSALAGEPEGARVMILLTDGDDQAHGATLADAVSAVRHAGVVVYPIAVGGATLSPRPLQRLARAGNGRYVRVPDPAAIAAAYESVHAQLHRTWRLEYVTAARPGERVELSVWAPGRGSTRVTATLPGGATGARVSPPAAGSAVADLVIAFVVGGMAFLAFRAFSAWRRAAWLRQRLGRRSAGAPEAARATLRDRSRSSVAGILGATERAGQELRPWRVLERTLERSQVPLRVVELLYLMVGSGFALSLVAALFAAPSFVILLALATGGAIPLLVVTRRARRRRQAFEDQLPDLLMTLASALKAGQSFRQGIQTIVEEADDPAAAEFRLVLSEARLGRPLEQSLAEMAERLGSKDFSFVVSAVTIQRQVGGSLAGIFDMVADAVRQRQQFARRIKALTATGRMSAYVLVALPIGLALVLTAMNPTYMSPLYGTTPGRAMIATGVVMMAMGALVLRKIVAFKG